MSLVINHNISATAISNTLNAHYASLGESTQRLSTGLRINSADDDAAGLAIRELMRTDIAAMKQGLRNINDAISMLQTADGALSIIDEKLIRMKELAEQAATGTYDSTQRLMIDSEFQQMASEINRIARSTEFNSIKILNTGGTAASGSTVDPTNPNITYPYTISEPDDPIINSSRSGGSLSFSSVTDGITDASTILGTSTITVTNNNTTTITTSSGVTVNVRAETSGDTYALPSSFIVYWDPSISAWKPDDSYNYTRVSRPTTSGTYSSDSEGLSIRLGSATADIWLDALPNTNALTTADTITVNLIDQDSDPTYKYTVVRGGSEVSNGTINTNHRGDTVFNFAIDLGGGNTVTYNFDVSGNSDAYTLTKFTATVSARRNDDSGGGGGAGGGDSPSIPDTVVKIHFGSGNDSAEDYYYIEKNNATTGGLGIAGLNIQTQENAQNALVAIDNAVVKKDQIRAYYGAMQNRLENTYSNISIQAENLQTAESRISDTDVAQEMTNFVRNQILTQSAVAMLAQANSLPQMALSLIS